MAKLPSVEQFIKESSVKEGLKEDEMFKTLKDIEKHLAKEKNKKFSDAIKWAIKFIDEFAIDYVS